MDQLSFHIAFYCHVPYDIFLNEMIFSLICINSQPISNVINVYYETHMMILKWTEYNIRVINYYFYFLFISPQKVGEVKKVLLYNALWWSPCDCVTGYVNKCCLKLSSVVLLCLSNPHGTFDVLFSTHANLAQWSGWNDPQCTWGNYWLSNCYMLIAWMAYSDGVISPSPVAVFLIAQFLWFSLMFPLFSWYFLLVLYCYFTVISLPTGP